MAQKTLHPTSSQVEAAKLLVEMLEEDHEPVDDKLRALAETQIDVPAHEAPATEPEAPPVNIKDLWAIGSFRSLAPSALAQPWATLVTGPAHYDVPDEQLLLGEELTMGESSALVVAELKKALQGEVEPDQLSAEAQKHLLISDVDGHATILGVYLMPVARRTRRWADDRSDAESS